MTFDISPVRTKQDKADFLSVPYDAYRSDPNWRAPLRMMQADQINPAKNVALADMTHELFVARQNGHVVGRVAAMVNPAHLKLYNDQTGHFGFLDTTKPDPALVAALLAQAENFLKGHGMRQMKGPFNFSINEECGLLIDGFDVPPMILMPHGRPDYRPAYEAAGLTKAMDTFAFRFKFSPDHQIPAPIVRMKQKLAEFKDLRIRPMDMKNFTAEMVNILDMFNDAWSKNWQFIPFGQEQIDHMAKEMRPLLNAKSVWIAEYRGRPIAFAVFLPDLNEMIHGLDGRLLPFGWAQLLYRLKIRGPRRSRLPLAGLRREFQKTRPGFLAAVGSFEAAIAAQFEQGVEEIEASWVLEDNQDLIMMCRSYGMSPYKTYRIYEKAFS
ncbi:MAG: hypothetical protein AAF376_02555 [Pseudomonadota bacterium]